MAQHQIPTFTPANPTQVTNQEWTAFEADIVVCYQGVTGIITQVDPTAVIKPVPAEYTAQPTTPTTCLNLHRTFQRMAESGENDTEGYGIIHD
jgi:hypothetical protein